MKTLVSRFLAVLVLSVAAWLLLAGATAPKRAILEPDKFIILSTTDVKGHTDPCG